MVKWLIGGASVAINLGMMAYIGDIATEDVKVSFIFKTIS